ncbi:MAG: hypothetical protein VX938_06945, partial [Myxococcota bacterium]|nr:hypothetical protein [Myxococcota bacterium]
MAETEGANTSGRRALIVDHDREDAGMLGFHLKRQGLPTMVVTSQNEAWDAMSWGTPDVVVVELGHPNVDALEFAVALSGKMSGKMAALFVVAERAPTADEELTLLRLGVREIFLKPLDHRAVSQKMANADVRPLPQNSEIQSSSIRGALADHPVDALLDLARRHSLNARLMIQSPGQGEGNLIIRGGAVIDGVRGETSGRPAVLATAAAMDGRFEMSLL